MDIGTWELLSYIVTTIGLPAAILVFLYEQKKERDNEDEEVYQLLSDNYQDFLKIALDHPDLHLFSPEQTTGAHRRAARAHADHLQHADLAVRARLPAALLAEDVGASTVRRWLSWEDYMREWCRREDFRALLPVLLEGEDAEFCAYIRALADKHPRLIVS